MTRVLLGALIALLGVTSVGAASDYPPMDHRGGDLIMRDGDRIWGKHTRVGTFSVAAGTTVTVRPLELDVIGTSMVHISAEHIRIDGTLDATAAGWGGGGGGAGRNTGIENVGSAGSGGIPGGQNVFEPYGYSAGGGGGGLWAFGGSGGYSYTDTLMTFDGMDANGFTYYHKDGVKYWESLVGAGGGGGQGGLPAMPAYLYNPEIPGGGGGGGGTGGGAITLAAKDSFHAGAHAAILTNGTFGGNASGIHGGSGAILQEGLGAVGITIDTVTSSGRGGNGGCGAGGVIQLDLPSDVDMSDALRLEARGGNGTTYTQGIIRVKSRQRTPLSIPPGNGYEVQRRSFRKVNRRYQRKAFSYNMWYSIVTSADQTTSASAPGLLSYIGNASVNPVWVTGVSRLTAGAITVGVDGSFIYTANSDAEGASSFLVHVTDGLHDQSFSVDIHTTSRRHPDLELELLTTNVDSSSDCSSETVTCEILVRNIGDASAQYVAVNGTLFSEFFRPTSSASVQLKSLKPGQSIRSKLSLARPERGRRSFNLMLRAAGQDSLYWFEQNSENNGANETIVFPCD